MQMKWVLAVIVLTCPPAPPAVAEDDSGQDAISAAHLACHVRLKALADFEVATAPEADDDDCRMKNPVRLSAIRDGADDVALPARPVLDCEFAIAFARWGQNIAAPLARGIMDRKLTAIATGPGFVCKRRNNRPEGKLSEHAFGNAVDIASFRLGNANVPVRAGDDVPREEKRFLRAVRRAACGYFTTILGPGSNALHATHFHLDRGRLYKDGERRENPYRICN